jgi:hypothetical protein
MESHLDVHPFDYPIMTTIEGKVTVVYAKDHEANINGAVTLYQVEGYVRNPRMTHVFDFVPVKGQLTGCGNEDEDPLLVGQLVLLSFIGGDPNLPYIDGKWFDLRETEIAQEQADHPRIIRHRNGFRETIDKDGNRTLKLAEDRKITITDSSDNVLFEVIKSGGSYEVRLGGDSGIRSLIDDRLITAYNTHVHGGAGTPPTVPLGPPTTPVATTITKAK